jgi:hypothetical protein
VAVVKLIDEELVELDLFVLIVTFEDHVFGVIKMVAEEMMNVLAVE